MGPKLYLIALAIVAGVLLGIAFMRTVECDAADGVRLRSFFGTWECYDKASLRVRK